MTVFKFLPHAQTGFEGVTSMESLEVVAHYSYNKRARNITRVMTHEKLGEFSKVTRFFTYEKLAELLVLNETQVSAAAQFFENADGFRREDVLAAEIPGNQSAESIFQYCAARNAARKVPGSEAVSYESKAEREAVRIVSQHCEIHRIPEDVQQLNALTVVFRAFGHIDKVALAPGTGEWGTSVRFHARLTRELYEKHHPKLVPALQLRSKGTREKLRAWFAANNVFAADMLEPAA